MSVSLTITNLDDDTFRRLQAEAQRRGVDVEAAAKGFLSNNLPKTNSAESNGNANGPPYHDLDFLIGTWTEKEAAEFLSVVSEFRRIDPELWQ